MWLLNFLRKPKPSAEVESVLVKPLVEPPLGAPVQHAKPPKPAPKETPIHHCRFCDTLPIQSTPAILFSFGVSVIVFGLVNECMYYSFEILSYPRLLLFRTNWIFFIIAGVYFMAFGGFMRLSQNIWIHRIFVWIVLAGVAVMLSFLIWMLASLAVVLWRLFPELKDTIAQNGVQAFKSSRQHSFGTAVKGCLIAVPIYFYEAFAVLTYVHYLAYLMHNVWVNVRGYERRFVRFIMI